MRAMNALRRRAIDRFVDILSQAQLTATVRYSKGDDIAAGCGQLYWEMERIKN